MSQDPITGGGGSVPPASDTEPGTLGYHKFEYVEGESLQENGTIKLWIERNNRTIVISGYLMPAFGATNEMVFLNLIPDWARPTQFLYQATNACSFDFAYGLVQFSIDSDGSARLYNKDDFDNGYGAWDTVVYPLALSFVKDDGEDT